MKRIIGVVVVLLECAAFCEESSSSYTGYSFTSTVDGITYSVGYSGEYDPEPELPQIFGTKATNYGNVIIPNALTRKSGGSAPDQTYAIGRIRSGAFSGLKTLTSVALPSTVQRIGKPCFSGCPNLKAITAPASINFSDVEGVLFDKVKSVLVRYPEGKDGCSYAIPSSVSEISSYAFANCKSLVEITIPKAVMVVGDQAFDGCSRLRVVYTKESECSRVEELLKNSGVDLSVVTVLPEGSSYPEGNDFYCEIGGVTWHFAVADDGLSDIIGVSPRYLSGDVVLPSELGGHPVASIPTMMFAGSTELTSVKIPDSYLFIGDYQGFDDCTSLTNVEIGAGVVFLPPWCFNGCVNLQTVRLSEGLKEIHSWAFSRCCKLKSIVIPDSVTNVEYEAFIDCEGLVNVVLGNGTTKIEDSVFSGCSSLRSIDIGENIKEIGWYAFQGCASLGSLVIPDSVTNIGGSAFCGCESLKSVIIGKGIGFYGWNGGEFQLCPALEKVETASEIRDMHTFGGSRNIRELIFLSGVGQIRDNFFTTFANDFTNLSRIVFAETVTNLGVQAISHLDALTDVTLPASMTSIGDVNFVGCPKLERIEVDERNPSYVSVDGVVYPRDLSRIICFPEGKRGVFVMPNEVTQLEDFALERRSVEKLICGSSLTNIRECALMECGNLTSVRISSSVKTIGRWAFAGCENLKFFTFEGDAPDIAPFAFEAIPSDCKIFVPHGSTGWNVEIPGVWNGFEISWGETLPNVTPDADPNVILDALECVEDERLASNITDATTYCEFRDWALRVGEAEVCASPFAWVSFATDSAALLAKMPTDEDLKVEEFKPSPTAGSFDFTVSVKDVKIGDKASVDNLKKLFGLEGAESLDTAAFSSENVSLDFKEPQDGKLKFTATPAVDNAKSFFMKAKVK